MTQTDAVPPESQRRRPGFGWAIAAFVISLFTVVAGLVIVGLGSLWGGLALTTGAPGVVQLSILRQMYLIALPALGPLSLASIILAIIALLRRARGAALGLSITALALAVICLIALALGIPLLSAEPCFNLECVE